MNKQQRDDYQKMRDRDELVRYRNMGFVVQIQPARDKDGSTGWVDIPVELQRAREWAHRNGLIAHE